MGATMTQGILWVSLLVVVLLLLLQSRRLQQRDQELATAADALLEREQLATLGRMMAGIAHELNTPLGAVRCSVGTRQKAIAMIEEVITGLAEPNADRGDLLARANKAVEALHSTDPVLDEAMTRTDQLIREIRLAGRGQSVDPEPVAVNDLVRGTLLLAQHELKHGITVKLDLAEVPPVPGWPGPLGQVLLNLVVNARQAVGEEGTIGITTATVGDEVVITVADNGPGLPTGLGEKLFEAGFSTKAAQTGTGLGLYISRRILERHQGRIAATNGPHGGAVFTVTLPTTRAKDDCGICL